jgi:hypothetical protein
MMMLMYAVGGSFNWTSLRICLAFPVPNFPPFYKRRVLLIFPATIPRRS